MGEKITNWLTAPQRSTWVGESDESDHWVTPSSDAKLSDYAISAGVSGVGKALSTVGSIVGSAVDSTVGSSIGSAVSKIWSGLTPQWLELYKGQAYGGIDAGDAYIEFLKKSS
jgi:hypothetical protein